MDHTSGHTRSHDVTARSRAARVTSVGIALTLSATLAGLLTPAPERATSTSASVADPHAGHDHGAYDNYEVAHTAAGTISPKPRVKTKTVEIGTRPRIEGKMPGPRGRKVTLSVQPPDTFGFKRIDVSRLDRRGIYLFKPRAATKPGRFVYKVDVKRDGALKSKTRKFVYTVTAEPDTETPVVIPVPPVDNTPKGSPSDWTYLVADKQIRWDPCTPITWHYDGTLAPYAAEADMNAAVASVTALTGHTFVRVATAEEAVFDVTWSNPTLTPNLDGFTLARGGFTYYPVDAAINNGTVGRAHSGIVVLDASEVGRPGFTKDGPWTWGQVMVHEVMHALGLGHASGVEQVMHPTVSKHNHAYGAGDLTGLSQVGAPQGCMAPLPWEQRHAKQRVGTIAWAE